MSMMWRSCVFLGRQKAMRTNPPRCFSNTSSHDKPTRLDKLAIRWIGVGSALGFCNGLYEGYTLTKREDYAECLVTTLLSGGLGVYMGGITMMLLPLIIPVGGAIALLRYLDNQPGIPPSSSNNNKTQWMWVFH